MFQVAGASGASISLAPMLASRIDDDQHECRAPRAREALASGEAYSDDERISIGMLGTPWPNTLIDVRSG